jgi:hypothetical protein
MTQPMNDIVRLQATVRVLHRMYELYEDECNEVGGPGRMIFTDWLRYMTDNGGDEYPLDGIIWPQEDKEPVP